MNNEGPDTGRGQGFRRWIRTTPNKTTGATADLARRPQASRGGSSLTPRQLAVKSGYPAAALSAAESGRRPAWKSAETRLLRHQLAVIQRQLGERTQPKVTWADRALIAILLGLMTRTRHHRLHLIVTPATILRWRRDILRCRWAARSKPKGRPATRRNIKALVVRTARENDGWGYRRIEVTMTIGLAELDSRTGTDAAFRAADLPMLQRKRSQRRDDR